MFPLYDNPLQLAHHYWALLLTPNDVVVDATCGNGHDTLVLAGLAEQVHSWDIQEIALQISRERVKGLENVTFALGCHSKLCDELETGVKLGVYNLGYLPGGDKGLTTRVETTLESVKKMSALLVEGGALSITCYPGHTEGAGEEEVLLKWAQGLSSENWCVVHHRFANRLRAPTLLWIQKALPQDSTIRRG